jgi:hypothetical protein
MAFAFSTTVNVTFSWATDGIAKGWTSSAPNSLANVNNSTYFTSLTTNNSITYYNSDFATVAEQVALGCGPGLEAFRAQYACKIGGTKAIPTAAAGDLGPGASATGTLTVTDTTLTGVLTVINTNDEGAGLQFGTTAATGYNVRGSDGSPFKNVWYGVSSQTTLTVSLTGAFTDTPGSWSITGGTITINDPSFQCGVADFSGVLCNPSTVSGGFTSNGEFLSWGLDASGPGGVTEIQVRDATGTNVLSSLSGVLASLNVDGAGNITTTQGEFRSASGNNGQGCPTGSIRYSGTGITCGTLQVGLLSITGGVGFEPLVNSDEATTTVATSVDIPILANDFGINLATAPVELVSAPLNGSATIVGSGAGRFARYIPAPGFSGVDTFQYGVEVGAGVQTATVTVTVLDPPAPFAFAPQSGVAPGTTVTSNTISITGNVNPAAIVVSGAPGSAYSVGCTGVFTAVAGTIASNQTVCVRHTSAAGFGANATTVLTIGGVSGAFTSTTEAQDTSPDHFAFPSLVADPDALATSAAVVVAGINDAAAVSISGSGAPEYSVNGGPFTSGPGSITNGQSVTIRLIAGGALGSTRTATLDVGGVTATFSVTTRGNAADDQATVSRDTPSNIAILTNDAGFDLDAVIIDIVTGPANGSVTIVGSGASRVARYTPSPGFVGTDSFQYGLEQGPVVAVGTVTVRVIDDPDGDGISADVDNCQMVANANQRDTDGDGYGNPCDGDFNNDGRVNFTDLGIFRSRFGTTNPDADLDGNGGVNFTDLGRFRSLFGAPPGPSGLVP